MRPETCEAIDTANYLRRRDIADGCKGKDGFGSCGCTDTQECETCHELFCDSHGISIDGVWYCFRDAKEALDVADMEQAMFGGAK